MATTKQYFSDPMPLSREEEAQIKAVYHISNSCRGLSREEEAQVRAIACISNYRVLSREGEVQVKDYVKQHKQCQMHREKGEPVPEEIQDAVQSFGYFLKAGSREQNDVKHQGIPDMQGMQFNAYNFSNTDFSNVNMNYIRFERAILDRINLDKTSMKHAHLKCASLQHATLRRTKLTYTDFQKTDLTGADLRGADLTHANLKGAILTDADLRNANLTNARLEMAFLIGTDLTGAILQDTNLIYTVFINVKGLPPNIMQQDCRLKTPYAQLADLAFVRKHDILSHASPSTRKTLGAMFPFLACKNNPFISPLEYQIKVVRENYQRVRAATLSLQNFLPKEIVGHITFYVAHHLSSAQNAALVDYTSERGRPPLFNDYLIRDLLVGVPPKKLAERSLKAVKTSFTAALGKEDLTEKGPENWANVCVGNAGYVFANMNDKEPEGSQPKGMSMKKRLTNGPKTFVEKIKEAASFGKEGRG